MSVLLSSSMPVVNIPVWVELMPSMSNDDVAITNGDDGKPMPSIYHDKAEGNSDIKESQEMYLKEISDGERDKGDVWEGYVALVSFDGPKMNILDEVSLDIVDSYDWTVGRI